MGKLTSSPMQDDLTHCYVCGRYGTENHHCIKASNRKHSDKYKLIVGLCPEHHRGTSGVHGRDGHELDEYLKAKAQEVFEKQMGTTEDFFKIFGRYYK